MKELMIASWESWKSTLGQILANELKKSKSATDISNLLFRGHGCASWKLESSLERKRMEIPDVESYAAQLNETKVAIESYIGSSWPTEYFAFSDVPSPPENYEFMVYLRHHGYPTPLLDWSRSPYIATFFAFQYPSTEKSVAIFSFGYFNGDSDFRAVESSNVVGCGPNIRTHKRHYAQQAEYTYCRMKKNGKWYYSSHELAFGEGGGCQGRMQKYILPSCIRQEVLSELDAMNINAYTLFESQEGLAEMLANRQYRYEY